MRNKEISVGEMVLFPMSFSAFKQYNFLMKNFAIFLEKITNYS